MEHDVTGLLFDPGPEFDTGMNDQEMIQRLRQTYGEERGMEIYRKFILERAKLLNSIKQKGFTDGR